MKAKHIMSRDLQAVRPEESIKAVAEKMRYLNLSTLPVTEDGRLVGIVRDHDIAARSVAEGRNAENDPIAEIMYREPKFCYADELVENIARRMAEEKLHHLVVLDRDQTLVGFLSLSDISAHTEGLARKVLKEISEPSPPLTISSYTQEKPKFNGEGK
jgi:CBS domain-containing protein